MPMMRKPGATKILAQTVTRRMPIPILARSTPNRIRNRLDQFATESRTTKMVVPRLATLRMTKIRVRKQTPRFRALVHLANNRLRTHHVVLNHHERLPPGPPIQQRRVIRDRRDRHIHPRRVQRSPINRRLTPNRIRNEHTEWDFVTLHGSRNRTAIKQDRLIPELVNDEPDRLTIRQRQRTGANRNPLPRNHAHVRMMQGATTFAVSVPSVAGAVPPSAVPVVADRNAGLTSAFH